MIALGHPVLELGCLQEMLTQILTTKFKSIWITLKLNPVKADPKRHICAIWIIHVLNMIALDHPVLELGCLQETLTQTLTTKFKSVRITLNLNPVNTDPKRHICPIWVIHVPHMIAPGHPVLGVGLSTRNFNTDFNHKV